jgi:hypothetical protein
MPPEDQTSHKTDHREGKTIWKVSSWRLLFLLEFMLKLAIFANQLLILALEFPLVSHARTAGAIGILGYLTSVLGVNYIGVS